MNPLTRWLEARSRRRLDRDRARLEQDRALLARLNALIEGMRARLDPQVYEQLAEYAGQTEWELAIDIIREASGRDLTLTPVEHDELAALANHPSVNQVFLAEHLANR